MPMVVAKRASVLECGGPPPLPPLSMLKDYYLSNIIKKKLNKTICMVKLCFMISATQIGFVLLGICIYVIFRLRQRSVRGATSKTNILRLERIRNASFVFQMLTWMSLVFGAYWFLAFLFGWPALINDKLRVVTSQSHIYESPGEMPPTILNLWIIKTCLSFFCMGVFLRLFRLYGRGILFSAKNVVCIRFFGWWLIINWAIDYQMQGLAKDMNLSTMPGFVGLLTLFIAWIMDEGRKIQEEQELTV